MTDEKKHVYIIGSKGIPAKYGGFETFVEKLTEYQVDQNIQYHVACMTENSAKSGITDKHFEHNGAKCFNIDVPNVGPARAIYYDIAAIRYAIKLAKMNHDKKPIFYVLACRIGPFIKTFKKQIKDLDGQLFINPDGHEWMRAKWSYSVRLYWKYSERLMVKRADLLICDSKNIEKYIKDDYSKYYPETIFISYGTDVENSNIVGVNDKLEEWYREKKVTENNYYLIVGRFVPENNFETMIREFMYSKTNRDLVIITTADNDFLLNLETKLHFKKDKRVKFVGTVYDQYLLKKIRENAHAYFHGHMVGGTNPSLLEALISTKINLLIDVGFNKEVAERGAYYWNLDEGNLAGLIEYVDNLNEDEISKISTIAKKRIMGEYTWDKICHRYEQLLLE